MFEADALKLSAKLKRFVCISGLKNAGFQTPTFSFLSTKGFICFGVNCPFVDLGMLIHHFLFKVLSLCLWFTVKSPCALYLQKVLLAELFSFTLFFFLP